MSQVFQILPRSLNTSLLRFWAFNLPGYSLSNLICASDSYHPLINLSKHCVFPSLYPVRASHCASPRFHNQSLVLGVSAQVERYLHIWGIAFCVSVALVRMVYGLRLWAGTFVNGDSMAIRSQYWWQAHMDPHYSRRYLIQGGWQINNDQRKIDWVILKSLHEVIRVVAKIIKCFVI